MRPEIVFHKKALKEFINLDKEIQVKFNHIAFSLSKKEKISRIKFKKLSRLDLFEIRVKNFRAIGNFFKSNFLIVLFIKKKTQKIPKKDIETAKRRMKEIT